MIGVAVSVGPLLLRLASLDGAWFELTLEERPGCLELGLCADSLKRPWLWNASSAADTWEEEV